MQPLVVFGVGMVGALAPEIIRLYALRAKGESFSLFYCVISLLFAALGGFIAVILPATTLWGAFYAGISAPVLVSTAAKKGLNKRGNTTALRGPSPLSYTAPQTVETAENTAQPSFIKFINAL